jgi:nudix-type nucleoside diphosphatase (YffH/AdpP family)
MKTKITGTEVVYDGYFKLNKHSIKRGDVEYSREVFERGNSVAGIVYDTIKDKYIFIKQWRPGSECDLIEIVAGSMDVEGEKPSEALEREIVEEIGYKVDNTQHLMDFYSSPGANSEMVSLFYVEVSEKISEGGGVDNENIEIIEVDHLGPSSTIFYDTKYHHLTDAKSIIAVMQMYYKFQ